MRGYIRIWIPWKKSIVGCLVKSSSPVPTFNAKLMLISYRFSYEATYIISYRFLCEATGTEAAVFNKKIPPVLPFTKGGTIPLFDKEGEGRF